MNQGTRYLDERNHCLHIYCGILILVIPKVGPRNHDQTIYLLLSPRFLCPLFPLLFPLFSFTIPHSLFSSPSSSPPGIVWYFKSVLLIKNILSTVLVSVTVPH
jgi:hypothetical protein